MRPSGTDGVAQVSFVGEGGDDYGGLFRESIRELAADLQNPHATATALFIPAPNQRHGVYISGLLHL